ncbi:MAG: polymer-forming cytoskeletal protein [Candidatus Brocadia sp.]|nr:polymer-forming cytoskeletal protein [Candidatus Brocadia sp.]
MNSKSKEQHGTRDIVCPYCQQSLTVSVHCISIPCRHCNRHIDVKTVLSPPEEKKKPSLGDRRILCYKCEKEIFTNKKAQAVICNYCYHHNDLNDYKIKAVLGKHIETHGTLYLKKKGVIDISSIRVGNAIIKGKIQGDLYAKGTVEILKPGEIYGKITCRKLIVNKGGIFSGSVRMLPANPDV